MKAVILAGGLGTRLSEETSLKPKPMVEIGGKPILWHIMKMYSATLPNLPPVIELSPVSTKVTVHGSARS